MTFGSTVIRCFLLLAAMPGLAASRVAVTLDVSGSMKHYGNWQPDAIAVVQAILEGTPVPETWKVTGNMEALSQYHLSGANVALLKFGTVERSAEYPFFRQISKPLTISELADQFPVEPKEYSEGRTNSSLAEMVSASLIDVKDGPALVIMISDFLKDVDLSERQLQYLNDMQSRYARYTLATLSWTKEPKLQIKLLKFVIQSQGEQPVPRSEGRLHLLSPKYDPRLNSVSLAWKYEGGTGAQKYDIAVRGAPDGQLVFEKNSIAATNITYQNPQVRAFRWLVTAYLSDGTEVRQSAIFNLPEEIGSPFGWMVLVLALIALVALGIFLLKKYGPPQLAFLKKKKEPDF